MNLLNVPSNQKVAVVTGGWSRERDRSLASAEAVLGALDELGLKAKTVDLEADRATLATDLGGADVALLAIAGQGAEDGVLQGFLETLGIPYTGSGVLTSALGMNKIAAKETVRPFILYMAPDCKFNPSAPVQPQVDIVEEEMPYPVIVKPLSEGGSIGVALARNRDELTAAISASDSAELMVEGYVKGVSVSVGVLDGTEGPVALSPLETEALGGSIYSSEAKQVPGQAQYHCPARLSETALNALRRVSLTAHRALGCSGFSLHDFVVDEHDHPYWLEVNTLPGLTRNGSLARMAEADGISYPQLIAHILAGASVRRPATSTRSAA
ncbi:D-alanine--D-alanine ligase family protein [Streptomyces bacillaris]|uniref:D-alanine--D-alanine ligase family protein n=1 Tax=Streptomyces bacillaris TaxID=68179 RepID=UPI000516506C